MAEPETPRAREGAEIARREQVVAKIERSLADAEELVEGIRRIARCG